jgi:hypothetical protein
VCPGMAVSDSAACIRRLLMGQLIVSVIASDARMVKRCKACGFDFVVRYSGPGRPRSYCYGCAPEGTRWVGKKVARKAAA